MAGRGELGHTGGAVAKGLRRFHRFGKQDLRSTTANKAQLDRPWPYWKACQEHFSESHVSAIGLALDGTRLDGKDTLMAALCAPQTGQCCWCPPQVAQCTGGKEGLPRGHFGVRRFSPRGDFSGALENAGKRWKPPEIAGNRRFLNSTRRKSAHPDRSLWGTAHRSALKSTRATGMLPSS